MYPALFVLNICLTLVNQVNKKRFYIALDCTLEVVPFVFCFVQVMPFFRISFWGHRRSDNILACSGLPFFFWNLDKYEANLYTS